MDQELHIPVPDPEQLRALFGPSDRNARQFRRRFGIDIVSRDGGIKLIGDEDDVRAAAEAVHQAMHLYRRDRRLSEDTVRRLLDDGSTAESSSEFRLPRGVRPRSKGQDRYVAALRKHAMNFAVGPAGTGKTFLAAAVGVAQLRENVFRKIVLCRPAVEAGEHLGFLPGDFQAKINPYLRPLYDALFNLLDVGQVRRYVDSDVIEVAPLAYMRGRTLERAFIILDEAQNTTPGQMKMFLTRMGRESKVVVTGDITQVDLPSGQSSGLVEALALLDDVEGIGISRLGRGDIVRHPLVQRIVDAYDHAPSGDKPSGASAE